MMKTKWILTPYFLDQPLPGLEEQTQPDWIINHQPLPEGEVINRISFLHGPLAQEVQNAVKDGHIPVSLAGDCCTTIGVWAGLYRSTLDPLLIWFDAHGDFNTWDTTPSGFLGGMPLAMLAGLGEQTLLESLDVPPMAQEKIILTDGRDLDPGEIEMVADSGITHLLNPLELLDYPFRDGPIWIHFDTDVLNPDDSPAQNYLAPGGPKAEEMVRVFEHIRDTGLIQAVSLSSWAPDLPGAEKSAQVSLELLETLIKEK
jgi:arginase